MLPLGNRYPVRQDSFGLSEPIAGMERKRKLVVLLMKRTGKRIDTTRTKENNKVQRHSASTGDSLVISPWYRYGYGVPGNTGLGRMSFTRCHACQWVLTWRCGGITPRIITIHRKTWVWSTHQVSPQLECGSHCHSAGSTPRWLVRWRTVRNRHDGRELFPLTFNSFVLL